MEILIKYYLLRIFKYYNCSIQLDELISEVKNIKKFRSIDLEKLKKIIMDFLISLNYILITNGLVTFVSQKYDSLTSLINYPDGDYKDNYEIYSPLLEERQKNDFLNILKLHDFSNSIEWELETNLDDLINPKDEDGIPLEFDEEIKDRDREIDQEEMENPVEQDVETNNFFKKRFHIFFKLCLFGYEKFLSEIQSKPKLFEYFVEDFFYINDYFTSSDINLETRIESIKENIIQTQKEKWKKIEIEQKNKYVHRLYGKIDIENDS